MDFVTPELLEAMIADRRRMAQSFRIATAPRSERSPRRLRRLMAGALAVVAARIHFESAQVAVGVRSAADAER